MRGRARQGSTRVDEYSVSKEIPSARVCGRLEMRFQSKKSWRMKRELPRLALWHHFTSATRLPFPRFSRFLFHGDINLRPTNSPNTHSHPQIVHHPARPTPYTHPHPPTSPANTKHSPSSTNSQPSLPANT